MIEQSIFTGYSMLIPNPYDNLDRFSYVQLKRQVVITCPFFNTSIFDRTKLAIGGWNDEVCISCILIHEVAEVMGYGLKALMT
jgi:hypothetical protein